MTAHVRDFGPVVAIAGFDGDKIRLQTRTNGQLWQRVAEGKCLPALLVQFYKRRAILGSSDE